jgi:hypothetical protein
MPECGFPAVPADGRDAHRMVTWHYKELDAPGLDALWQATSAKGTGRGRDEVTACR